MLFTRFLVLPDLKPKLAAFVSTVKSFPKQLRNAVLSYEPSYDWQYAVSQRLSTELDYVFFTAAIEFRAKFQSWYRSWKMHSRHASSIMLQQNAESFSLRD